MPSLVVTQDVTPWFVKLSFPYNQDIKDFVKQLPGPHMKDKWDPIGKTWRVASECVPLVFQRAQANGFECKDKRIAPLFGVQDARLHEYQRAAVSRGLAEKRWFFADEMGLGKTAEAISTIRNLDPRRWLVVCPAVVRLAWEKEIRRWWPENKEEIGLIVMGERLSSSKRAKDRADHARQCRIQIVSYNLLNHVPVGNWDLIIFDECHRLKNPAARWSKIAREVSNAERIYGLSATLMPDKPLDVCGIVECICPGRFGGLNKAGKLPFKLQGRYANAEHNGYGWGFRGINPLYADELAQRVRGFSSRTTKLEVAHLLPPFDVSYLEVQPTTKKHYQALQESLGGTFRLHEEKVDLALMKAGQEKFDSVLDWADDAVNNTTHAAICTHLKETAYEIAQRCEQRYPEHKVYCITGDKTPEKRNELLAEAAAQPRAIVVATMHSVGIGIDLTFCTAACVAELYYRPETLIQLLGRFSRLSGKVPSSVTILVLKGSIDEAIAFALKAKIEALNEAVKGGLSETELVNNLASSEQDFLALVQEAAASMVADPYDC